MRHFLLRASVPIEGRCILGAPSRLGPWAWLSLTLYEEVHAVKSKEKPNTHQRFLQQLKTMLPPDCRPIFVTDAGFRTPWFKQVEALGWDWVESYSDTARRPQFEHEFVGISQAQVL